MTVEECMLEAVSQSCDPGMVALPYPFFASTHGAANGGEVELFGIDAEFLPDDGGFCGGEVIESGAEHGGSVYGVEVLGAVDGFAAGVGREYAVGFEVVQEFSFDPEGGVVGEGYVELGVKVVCGVDEAEVSCADEIGEVCAGAGEVLCEVYDECEVGGNQEVTSCCRALRGAVSDDSGFRG